MTDYAVVVTGATGKTGQHVAAGAVARGWQVRSATRSAPPHGDWFPLDWDDESTWAPVFAGCDAAYVIIPFNHPGAAERTPRLMEVAASCGVRRIVLLSSLDVDSAEPDSPLRAAEAAVGRLPVRSAILRPTWFLDNFTTGSFRGMTQAGELRLPAGDGRIPQIDVRDVADVAVAALADGGPEGVLPLTGPEELDHHQVAAALSEGLGRRVTYTSVPVEEFVQVLTTHGFSREYGVFLGAALAEVAAGRLRIPVAGTVERVTGRPGRTALEFARHHASVTGHSPLRDDAGA
ncbi:hypothetical protein FKR81_00255 [Lentzea tibetensis]|uniref:NAD(P)-binding domain-containing protein n=1 Tax=Lentzea tibetensis TaxID=2591470 RepID=A0A563F249_9PSEU|nr:NAD(P)H-binding protein [Lentzea tibetensis]TWP54040.1 hypothetical protein FKR81_00255 [Lentzea tibetensis]